MRVAVVQMQGDGDIARRCAVQVVVDVGAALPGEAERRVVQQRFNVAGATGQRQRAGVVAGNRNRLAAGGAGGGAGVHVRAADAEGAGRRGDGDGHRRAEGGGFGVLHHDIAADKACLIFINGTVQVGHGQRARIVDFRGANGDGRRAQVAAFFRYGGAVPVVLGGVDGGGRRASARRRGLVQRAAVSACRQRAACVAQAVIGDSLHLIGGVAVGSEGHRQARQRRVHLGAGAAQDQIVVLAAVGGRDLRAAAGRVTQGHVAVFAGHEGAAVRMQQTHGHLQIIALAIGHAVCQIPIFDREARQGVARRRGAGDVLDARRRGHFRRVVGRAGVDPERVAGLLFVAVRNREGELIVRGGGFAVAAAFGAVVQVVNVPVRHILLGEGGAFADGAEVHTIFGIGQGAVGRRAGDGVLQLH